MKRKTKQFIMLHKVNYQKRDFRLWIALGVALTMIQENKSQG
ncbi:hypothetical protein [uncultured Helicobacter sp.]|nr:hypothetical protein [uncultured Helicobacter sp.]